LCDYCLPLIVPPLLFVFFFFSLSRAPLDLHSFPTRRSSDLFISPGAGAHWRIRGPSDMACTSRRLAGAGPVDVPQSRILHGIDQDRKSTRLNSSHLGISYAVFCLKKKKIKDQLQCRVS